MSPRLPASRMSEASKEAGSTAAHLYCEELHGLQERRVAPGRCFRWPWRTTRLRSQTNGGFERPHKHMDPTQHEFWYPPFYWALEPECAILMCLCGLLGPYTCLSTLLLSCCYPDICCFLSYCYCICKLILADKMEHTGGRGQKACELPSIFWIVLRVDIGSHTGTILLNYGAY